MTEVDEHPDVDPAQRLLDQRLRNGAWLDAQDFPPLQWAVPGIIPEGMGLLTGPPKAGKSWAALGIGLAVATGGRALGRIPTGQPRPVLYLALEDGCRRLQERCRKLLVNEPIPPLWEFVTSADAAEVPTLIAAWLARNGHRRPLVMLDTLGKVTPPAHPGESAYARDYRVASVLKSMVDSHPGATLLVVHHVRKQVGEDWMDGTSGTNGLNGAADFTVNLNRQRGAENATLRVTGRDVRDGEYAVHSVEGSWYLDGRSLDEAEAAAAQARVVAGLGETTVAVITHVNGHPEGVRAVDVARALDIPETTARQYLRRAEGAGRIVKRERGLYTPVTSVTSVTSHDERDTCDGSDTLYGDADPWAQDDG